MGKQKKQDEKPKAERPDVATAKQYIAETEANLELLDAEKKALKANLKDAKKQLKKLLKAKPEKVKAEKKPKLEKAKAKSDGKQKAKTPTAQKAAGKKLTKV
jgi:outer membrane protein TolC